MKRQVLVTITDARTGAALRSFPALVDVTCEQFPDGTTRIVLIWEDPVKIRAGEGVQVRDFTSTGGVG